MHPMIHRMFVIAGTLLALAPVWSTGQETEAEPEAWGRGGFYLYAGEPSKNQADCEDTLRQGLADGSTRFFKEWHSGRTTIGAYFFRSLGEDVLISESERLARAIEAGDGDAIELRWLRAMAFAAESHFRRAIADLNAPVREGF